MEAAKEFGRRTDDMVQLIYEFLNQDLRATGMHFKLPVREVAYIVKKRAPNGST